MKASLQPDGILPHAKDILYREHSGALIEASVNLNMVLLIPSGPVALAVTRFLINVHTSSSVNCSDSNVLSVNILISEI